MDRHWMKPGSFCIAGLLTAFTSVPTLAADAPSAPLQQIVISTDRPRSSPVPLPYIIRRDDTADYLRWMMDIASQQRDMGTREETEAPKPVPDSTGIPDKCSEKTAHPVVIASGKKVITDEVDFATEGEMPLNMTRMYDKFGSGLFVARWRSTFDYALRFEYSGGAVCENWPSAWATPCSTSNITSVHTRRPDGALYSFTWDAGNGRWEDNKPTSINWIEQVGSNWVLHTEGGSTETYLSSGVISSIVNEHGISWTFNYSGTTGGLQSVLHSSGRSVSNPIPSASAAASAPMRTSITTRSLPSIPPANLGYPVLFSAED